MWGVETTDISDLSYVQTDATIPSIVAPTTVGVVG